MSNLEAEKRLPLIKLCGTDLNKEVATSENQYSSDLENISYQCDRNHVYTHHTNKFKKYTLHCAGHQRCLKKLTYKT